MELIFIVCQVENYRSTLDFFISNLGFCLELGLLNSETETGTGFA